MFEPKEVLENAMNAAEDALQLAIDRYVFFSVKEFLKQLSEAYPYYEFSWWRSMGTENFMARKKGEEKWRFPDSIVIWETRDDWLKLGHDEKYLKIYEDMTDLMSNCEMRIQPSDGFEITQDTKSDDIF